MTSTETPPQGQADGAAMGSGRFQQGPVQMLCKEIGFPFDRRLERPAVLVAFVRELVGEIEHKRAVMGHIAHLTGKAPSEGSATVLALAAHMLAGQDRADLIARAAAVHHACDELNPDDAVPTDHDIDMLSSCASAIRFGLEEPCHSRHAAGAASHVWKQTYGVSLFDQYTGAWEKDWARNKLICALTSMAMPAPEGVATTSASVGEVRDGEAAERPNPESSEIAQLKVRVEELEVDRDEWRERARQRDGEADTYSKRAWAAESRLAASEAKNARLRDALNQWKCPSCGGKRTYPLNSRTGAGEIVPCKVCEETGLHPIARQALPTNAEGGAK